MCMYMYFFFDRFSRSTRCFHLKILKLIHVYFDFSMFAIQITNEFHFFVDKYDTFFRNNSISNIPKRKNISSNNYYFLKSCI